MRCCHPQTRGGVCQVEELEPRQYLAADTIQVGAVYYDPHAGNGLAPQVFTINFQGGAPGTELTHLTIGTDKTDLLNVVDPGPNSNDNFFHTETSAYMPAAGFPFEIVNSDGITVTGVTVENDSTRLDLDFSGFTAGKTLTFSIKVDEAQNPNNVVVEGAEFQGAIMAATFGNPDYLLASSQASFADVYSFAPSTGLTLPPDDYMPPSTQDESVYTAGAQFSATQTPLPSSLSGTVKVQTTPDWDTNPADPPVSGVEVELLDSTGAVLQTTTTDADGNYEFNNLLPGVYTIQDVQPNGYFPGNVSVGSESGLPSGSNAITAINLGPNRNGTRYDFGVLAPSDVSGYVKIEPTAESSVADSDPGLSGVTLELFDANNHLVGTTSTDANGYYAFQNLMPGTYQVHEVAPTGYFAGQDQVGSLGGTLSSWNDITAIPLAGIDGHDYNFSVTPPNSLSGYVKVETTSDWWSNPADPPLAGVTIELFDSSNNLVATTVTNTNGYYAFANLYPDTYTVREIQPAGYSLGDNHVGSQGGVAADPNNIITIGLSGGASGTDYDFGVASPGSISGYVFQDGPPISVGEVNGVPTTTITAANSGRTGIRNASDPPIAGVTMILADANGIPLFNAQGAPITTVTDADGFYTFSGVAPGQYTVFEVEPSGYIKGLDTAGSTGGLALNPGVSVPATFLGTNPSAIIGVTVTAGQASVNNNFSELATTSTPFYFVPAQLAPQTPPVTNYYLPNQSLVPPPPRSPIAPFVAPSSYQVSAGAAGFTWHLSVINAGQPRGDAVASLTGQQRAVGDWDTQTLQESRWELVTSDGKDSAPREVVFGMSGGIPVTGDFNGDGVTDVGVFLRGQWFVDLNGNGVWDKDDLWAKLGYADDLPVTGDWDGDGKTDIGIYGHAWPGDPRAVAAEPGLPDPDNKNAGVRKNGASQGRRRAAGWPRDAAQLRKVASGPISSTMSSITARRATIPWPAIGMGRASRPSASSATGGGIWTWTAAARRARETSSCSWGGRAISPSSATSMAMAPMSWAFTGPARG